jgi:N-acetylglutamate synthase-like GNAT family acetyltransferase
MICRMNVRQKSEAIIRNARAQDIGAIKRLYQQLSSDVSNVDEDFPLLTADPNARCLILEIRNKPIGMVICYIRPSLSSGKKMVVEDLVVESQYRRRGFGSLLMHHCVDVAKQEDLDSVELACSLSRLDLHQFYERLGLKHRMRLYSLIMKRT